LCIFVFRLSIKSYIMRTIVIVGAVVLAGATIIGLMMTERKNETQPSFSSQGIPQAPADASSTGSASTSTSGSPALNPAHGQPGHRCELPVGAPLTGNASTQTPTTSPVATTQQAAPAGLALNPAHGQPGHRCDLPVGAPLTGTSVEKPATDSIK
jgi:hypothetical protein